MKKGHRKDKIYKITIKNRIESERVKKLETQEKSVIAIYLNKDLKIAIREGSSTNFDALLSDERNDPGMDYNAALSIAIEQQNETMVQKMLAHERVDASDDNNYHIIKACETNNSNIIKMLLEWEGIGGQKVNPSVYRNRCLQLMIKQNNEEIFNILVADIRVLSEPYITKTIEWAIGNQYPLGTTLKTILENL